MAMNDVIELCWWLIWDYSREWGAFGAYLARDWSDQLQFLLGIFVFGVYRMEIVLKLRKSYLDNHTWKIIRKRFWWRLIQVYSGAFGAHVAMIMRRLYRICVYYNNPLVQFVACSATIADPAGTFGKLFPRFVSTVICFLGKAFKCQWGIPFWRFLLTYIYFEERNGSNASKVLRIYQNEFTAILIQLKLWFLLALHGYLIL